MLILKSYGKATHFGFYRSEQGLSAVQEAPRAEVVRRKATLTGAWRERKVVLRVLVCAVEGGFMELDSQPQGSRNGFVQPPRTS